MYFDENSLLGAPVSRAAYSDRTAWLMAEMSRLAYFKFEGEDGLDALAEALMQLDNKKMFIKKVKEMILTGTDTKSEAEDKLGIHLDLAGFKLVKPFNNKDTQAFLAVRESDKMAVLAFRGTEMNIADIRTDLKTTSIDIDGFSVHEGFYKAFKMIDKDVKDELKALGDDYVLYITGHSLGGALALLAAKYLGSDSLGACYTFGGPRVASQEFSQSIKTPIYRVINAADIVPRIPPAFLPRLLVYFLPYLPVPFLRSLLINFFKKMIGYRHHGDMRQLTACLADFSDLKLLANPNMVDRGIQLVKRWISTWGKAAAADHSIEIYSNKLKQYAIKRSQI